MPDPADFRDLRPEVRPNLFSYRELPTDLALMGGLLREMRTAIGNPEWVRMTVVSPEYPMPPYPDGLYMEGWEIALHRMPVLSKEAPFDFPMTAAPEGDGK